MNPRNYAGLTVARPKKQAHEKPILPDPGGTLLPLVAQAIENKKQVDACEGVLATAKGALAEAAFAHAAMLYQGRETKVEDTFQIGTVAGKALITLQNRYKPPSDLNPVRAILGERAAGLLRESVVIQIDADAMPGFIQQSFVDGLIRLARDLDAMLGTPEGESGPVFQSITVRQATTFAPDFHERRWSLLTPADNARLQKAMPCTIAVKLDY